MQDGWGNNNGSERGKERKGGAETKGNETPKHLARKRVRRDGTVPLVRVRVRVRVTNPAWLILKAECELPSLNREWVR